MEAEKYSLLKIFVSSTDKIGSKLVYENLVYAAKDFGISGVTVYRGIMGFGKSNRIMSSKFWELAEKLPIVIEMIDRTDSLENFYSSIEEQLQKMPKGCLVILEPISVKLHKKGGA